MNTSSLIDLLSHTALKGAAVLLVALILGVVLRRMAAARRYALWITAIVTLGVLPLAMWALPAWRVLPQAPGELDWPVMEAPQASENAEHLLLAEGGGIAVPAAGPALPMPVRDPAPAVFTWAISWQDVVASLPLVWMLIAGALLLRLGRSAWCLRRLQASLRPGECPMLEEAANELGLKRVPRLLVGPSDSVPMVWGVFRPRLLLPEGFAAWSPEKQRAVLLHELAHLKRGDPLALWAAQWVKALHWFNPLAWLTLRQLRADQERACDDAVLRQGVRASDYAQSLLDLSRHNRLAPGLSLCALTITRCAPVEARVKAILDPTRHRETLTLRWLAGLIGGALFITLPVAMLHGIEGALQRGRILDRNGVVLAESTKEKKRVYPLKTLAAHMVGYTRAPDKKRARIFGGAGMEKQQDAELAAGKDVTLTLDMRLQSLAYRAMKEAGVSRGAAVVLDPRTGEILAAVSLPSFDPNVFIPSITQENWERYLGNRDVPLLNRCLKGAAPGSTFKVLTGLAAGAAGISGEKLNCTGTVTYGSKAMQCWINAQNGGGHGLLGMSESLAVSCNCYWYQFGNAVGIEQIESMGRKVGFGSKYGITDDEDAGILPSPAWLKENRPQERWSAAHTANMAIGQGLVLATPLQMAVLAATVGNGGKVPQPRMIQKEEDGPWRVDMTQGTLTAAEVEPLREGMRLAVNSDSGTGQPARSDKVIIAGKTGTAQNWRIGADKKRVVDNHGWFIGFAPFENPQFAFAIVKQGAKSGGGDCGPIAKRIVEEALALPADGSGEVEPVGDEVGAAHEKLQQVRAQFEARTERVKAAIQGIKLNPASGFSLDGFEVSDGQLRLHGTASGMQQALQFRGRLVQLELLRSLEWNFPVPKTLADGKRVGFAMVGVVQVPRTDEEPVKKSGADTPPAEQAQVRHKNDADIRMKPALAHAWAVVKRTGLLADLPARARPFDLGDKHPEREMKSVTVLHFWASREEVRRWLVASHCVPVRGDFLSPLPDALASALTQPAVEDIAADWPAPPQPLRRTYLAARGCRIDLHAPDGENVTVTVCQSKPSILIAPDESQEPRPAGRLAPRLQRDGLTAAEPALRELDAVPQTLRPVTVAYEPKPRFVFRPRELKLKAPRPVQSSTVGVPHALIQLWEEIGPESEPGLLRSLQKSGRMQQTLWVKAAQP